ncbi:MAG: mannose-1-phosphate guanylyltransferase [Planctomycetota bacterium]
MLHAVIMAGGSGKRFWPMSRRRTPKQLLTLVGKKTLVQETVERLGGLVPPDRTYVITNEAHVEVLRHHLPDLPERNVVGEPVGRDTAACIALSAAIVSATDPDAVILTLPADHLIRPKQTFQETVRAAAEVARESDALVVFGVKPRTASTGYGYIRAGEKLAELRRIPVFRAKQFQEKPDAATARKYLESGDYYWNSGNFVWRASAILTQLEKHLPETWRAVMEIREAIGTKDEAKVLAREYEKLQRISIDYAVMEKADDVRMIEASYEWDDVGSWGSLENVFTRNKYGNVIIGKHCGIDTTNCIVMGDEHLVATIGVSDLIIVQTRDATLICHKDRAQDVRKLADQLEKEGFDAYL